MNIFYIDRLQDGFSIFSGFFAINSINQTFQILLLLTAGTIVGSIINFSKLSFNNAGSTDSLGVYITDQKYLSNYTFIILLIFEKLIL